MIKKSLKNAFIETFEETMKNKGFMRKGKVFHRIVNGKIVQLLSYYKFSGPEFTIQFSVCPLCIDNKYSTFMDASRVCEVFKDVESWEYEYQTDEYIQYMPEALKVTKEKLFPLFDSIINYETYSEKINIIEPFTPVFSHTVYMTNLVLGNYEASKESGEALINYRIETNQINWGTDHHINPATQVSHEQEHKEYYRIKEAMDNNDRKTIEQYIHEQEQKSLKSYIKAYTTPKKYEIFLETGVLPFKFVRIPDHESK